MKRMADNIALGPRERRRVATTGIVISQFIAHGQIGEIGAAVLPTVDLADILARGVCHLLM